jgi:NO-binding membrane sensor protein with MHYT domain/nitrogen-specific signal transduction histidine kinase
LAVVKVIYLCITTEHDVRLVALAAFICTFGCFTAVNLFVHAREARGRQRFLLTLAAAPVFGAAVWATHFVAELAFKPGLPIAYDFTLTALSMLIAVLLTSLGMIVALYYELPAVGGFIIGGAVAAMHYTGMAALRVPADMDWNPRFVLLSVAVGGLGASAALWVLCRGTAWRYRLWATGLLVLAICGLHFIAMAAIVLVPNPLIAIPQNVVAPQVLAVLVAAVSIGIAFMGMSLSIFEEQSTRRMRLEAEQLRLSREHLARAQRISAVGSIVRDLKTGRSECSDEFYRIYGLKPATFDPSTANVLSFVHPDDLPTAQAAQRASEAAGLGAPPLEYRIIRPSGEVRVVYREMELNLDAAGRPLRRIVTFKDITELRAAQEREKELERQLMQSQKLKALGTLAGGIAHELNNSLVPVLALARIVLDDLPEDDPLHEDISMIIGASERARDLVKQLLAYSRRQDLARPEIDLAAITRDALDALRASLPPHVRLVEQIEPVRPMRGDTADLQQVIGNLVVNAARAIGADQGTITVTLEMAGAHIRLAVADNGCGMDGATVDRIFEPFFTTKGVGQGTGLGLSIVHWLITGHRGQIDVQSRPGAGTVFEIRLPAAVVAVAVAAPAPA